MAFNKIHIIQQNLKATLAYVTNLDKTKDGTLVAGVNCSPFEPQHDMQNTKVRFGKTGGRQGYHLIQSFAHDEIAPEQAMEFGQAFVDRYLRDRYEAVIAVHADHQHIHCHIVWNAVSFTDGRKYHAPRGQYLDRVRDLSDELCRDRGLSVISRNDSEYDVEADSNTHKGQHYAAWNAEQNGRPTHRSLLTADIDQVLGDPRIITMRQFYVELEELGYELKFGKHLAVRQSGQDRFVRLKSLGADYTEEKIRQLLLDKGDGWAVRLPLKSVPIYKPSSAGKHHPPRGHQGFLALFWWHFFHINTFRKYPKSYKISPWMRAEVLKMDRRLAEYRLLLREKLDNLGELHAYRSKVLDRVDQLQQDKLSLKKTERTTSDGAAAHEISLRIITIDEQIREKRKELRMLASVELRSVEMAEQHRLIGQPQANQRKDAAAKHDRSISRERN